MRNLVPLLFVSVALFGCGGGGSSSAPPASVGENTGSSDGNLNGGLAGKLYFNDIYFYRELDLAKGEFRNLHGINSDGYSMPNRDATEFVQEYNEAASGDYNNEDIVFFNSDGQEIGRQEINGRIGEVRLSPDGQYVMFSWFSKGYGSGELVVMGRNGDWERNFGFVNTRAYDWSPDGKVYFCNDKNLFVVGNILADEPVLVSATANNVYHLNVSPDGEKLAFAGSQGGIKDGHIYVMGVDGGSPYQVTTSSLWEHSVAWSPDGQYLALIRGDSYTNIPDGYFDDSTEGNITPRVFVVKADSQKVDLSGDYPAGAVSVEYIENGRKYPALAFSDLAWRASK